MMAPLMVNVIQRVTVESALGSVQDTRYMRTFTH